MMTLFPRMDIASPCPDPVKKTVEPRRIDAQARQAA